MNILIVGGGSMGQAFARGLSSKENFHNCVVIEHNAMCFQKLETIGVKVINSFDEIDLEQSWAHPDICVIAVKPNDVCEVGKHLKKFLPTSCVVISIAAGMKISSLKKLVGNYPIIRAMPNIAASELLSATAICSANEVTETQLQNAREVLSTLGIVVRVREDEMNLVTAVSGSGPAYFFFLAEALIEAAKENGMGVEKAHQLVAQTFKGAAAMIDETGSFSSLRDVVTSPGGTTQIAIESLQDLGFEKMIEKAVKAAMQRGEELNSKDSGEDQ